MRATLRQLLDRPIDYAGLFPPAQLSMSAAVQEYIEALESSSSWIVDKFVCPASELENLKKTVDGHPVRVAVVGRDPEQDGKIIEASQDLTVESYELSVVEASNLESIVTKAKTVVEANGLDLFVEVGWGDDMTDDMHRTIAVFEETGFKARLGGQTAEAFPSVASFAAFLSECAGLECPFKYTAGIHEPLRHFDPSLGVYRHGFLVSMLAGALAVTKDLSRREIEHVLSIESHDDLHFGSDEAKVLGHWMESDDIAEFWEFFGGFGSCSIQEPIDGLRAIGLLEEAPA